MFVNHTNLSISIFDFVSQIVGFLRMHIETNLVPFYIFFFLTMGNGSSGVCEYCIS